MQSHIFHFVFRLTNCSNVLFWEFKCARYIHLRQGVTAIGIAFIILSIINVIILLCLPLSLCNIFIFALAFIWSMRLFQAISFIGQFTRIWFQNAFKFNADLLQIALKKEIASYSALSALNESFPSGINAVIADYVFHEAVQQLSSEQMLKETLRSVWKCSELTVLLIYQYSQVKRSEFISFCIGFGDGIGGCLNGLVVVEEGDGVKRALRLQIKYGEGCTETNENGVCLEFDVATREFGFMGNWRKVVIVGYN